MVLLVRSGDGVLGNQLILYGWDDDDEVYMMWDEVLRVHVWFVGWLIELKEFNVRRRTSSGCKWHVYTVVVNN